MDARIYDEVMARLAGVPDEAAAPLAYHLALHHPEATAVLLALPEPEEPDSAPVDAEPEPGENDTAVEPADEDSPADDTAPNTSDERPNNG